MSKQVVFTPDTNEIYLSNGFPKPSTKFIPKWYVAIKQYTNDDTKLKYPFNYGMPNVSIKKCAPFLDALTSGYMAYLNEDIHVEALDDGNARVRWRSKSELVTTHSNEQFAGFPITDDYYNAVYKWNNEWHIKTPKGYSVLFSHPANRFDLPFTTITGVVDCDYFPLSIKFPFILKKNFEGIIEAGTPVCQLNFVKREKWSSKVHKDNAKDYYKKYYSFFKTFTGSYKKNFWEKKSYQ
jgi:hypothetical protein